MSFGIERQEKIAHAYRAAQRRLSYPTSEKRMGEINTLLRKLDDEVRTGFEPLKNRSILIVEHLRYAGYIPLDIMDSLEVKITEKDSSEVPQNFAEILKGGNFDGAVIHMVSTSNAKLVREMSNRILRAGTETNAKIVVLLGNHLNAKLNLNSIYELFDSLHIGYVQKSGGSLEKALFMLARMFDES